MNHVRFLRRLLFFRRSQRWPRRKLDAHRDERLRRIVRHAARHVPYYRELFGEIGFDPASFRGYADLHRIPTLDKQTVRTRKDDLVADDARRHGRHPVSTSGTTGTPLKLVLSDATERNVLASLLRCYFWSGYRPYKRTLSVQSYYHEDEALRYKRLLNVLRFDSCRLSRASAVEAVGVINRMKPRFFMGFPFDYAMLTEFAAEAGLEIRPPDSLLCYGETLSREKRRLLETRLGCRVFDFYSHHEAVVMAAECEHGTLHLMEDFACHEILDDAGAGEGGELVGTTYDNYAMPLIRYRTGDTAVTDPDAAGCPCGRSLPAVARIVGKQSDYLKTPGGRVLGTVMSHAIDEAAGVVMSQCVQEAVDRITVRVVADDTYDAVSEAALVAGLRKRLGDRIRLDVVRVDRLEKSRLGKTPFIISRIGCDYG